MEFLLDGTPCTELDFAQKFAAEWEILKRAEIDVTFVAEGNRLGLLNEVGTPLFIEASEKLAYHKRYFYKHSKYKESLAKAIGLKRAQAIPKVIDATAGMLGDTLLLIGMGVTVTAFERNPVVAALGCNSFKALPPGNQFIFGQAQNYPEILEEADVIYFDPMFQEPSGKTTPKKAMQVFRNLVGKDFDAVDVAKTLKGSARRLVIKRPVKSSSILPDPTITFSGKAICYDVYIRKDIEKLSK